MNSPTEKVVRVRITSVDARTEHPFKADSTVAEVREFAYGRLVQEKSQTPFNGTWIEFGSSRLPEDQTIGQLVAAGEKNRGNEIDLTLTLAWDAQGGSA
jgi:hypothetical protein